MPTRWIWTNAPGSRSGRSGALHLQPRTFGETPTNYRAFAKALYEIGYEGYLCYEFCHPALNDRHEPAGIDKVDEQVRFALEYMQNVLSDASGE